MEEKTHQIGEHVGSYVQLGLEAQVPAGTMRHRIARWREGKKSIKDVFHVGPVPVGRRKKKKAVSPVFEGDAECMALSGREEDSRLKPEDILVGKFDYI